MVQRGCRASFAQEAPTIGAFDAASGAMILIATRRSSCGSIAA
jgi:hypothetical protein